MKVYLLVVLAILGGCGTARSSAKAPSPAQTPDADATAADMALLDSLVAWARTGEPSVLAPSTFGRARVPSAS
jgi:uncharacterized protein YceK